MGNLLLWRRYFSLWVNSMLRNTWAASSSFCFHFIVHLKHFLFDFPSSQAFWMKDHSRAFWCGECVFSLWAYMSWRKRSPRREILDCGLCLTIGWNHLLPADSSGEITARAVKWLKLARFQFAQDNGPACALRQRRCPVPTERAMTPLTFMNTVLALFPL